ncbi:PKD domain-containing protein [Candidatus Bathyarchaeota archaeon]|nr:PKD domain-containing protein [Candidatus Bathyarchaeota archaeon]
MNVNINVNKQKFIIREPVFIRGHVSVDDTPIQNGLVAVQVIDSKNKSLIYRTLAVGEPKIQKTVELTSVSSIDSVTLLPRKSFNLGETACFNVSIRNWALQDLGVVVTINVYDKTFMPLAALSDKLTLISSSTANVYFFVLIPEWACIGGAIAVANAYTHLPMNGGTPYCLEKFTSFNITRGPGTIEFKVPNVEVSYSNGSYILNFRLPPDSKDGSYYTYVTAKSDAEIVTEKAVFQVYSTEVPPQASFTYVPAKPYVNQSVMLDASASSAEGYEDFIVQYSWDFGDGQHLTICWNETTNSWNYTEAPYIAYHSYKEAGTYLITLNVTDHENLWSSTTKPIIILPPTGPTADFIWTVTGNLTIRFDASISSSGWNGTSATPIVSYEWDFGDGNITTTANPVILHSYLAPGNYSVTLKVTDSQGLQDEVTQTVPVKTVSYPSWDINQDGVVNAKDAVILGVHFGAEEGQPQYLQPADINRDGFINAKDAVILGLHFGEIYS